MDATLAVMAKLDAQEQVLHFVNRYRCKDGSYRFIEWRSHPEGKRIYAAARDITERRLVLEELEAQREQFQLAIRGTDDGIWDWKIKSNELFLSEHWKKMLGYGDEELPNETDAVVSLIYEEDRERVLQHIQRYLRKGMEKFSLEFRMRHKDGSLRWILAKGEALWDEKGIPYRMAGSHSDITERKRAERELELQSAMQEILMQTAKRYINISLDKVGEPVEQSLREISRFVGAHRAYVFDYHWDAAICTNTYEWCDQGISPHKEALQEVPLSLMPWWVEAHRRGEALHIPDVLALPEEDGVRQLLEPQEVQSLMAVPMMDGGECVGFVGFDSVTAPHVYTEREKALLEVFAEIMVNLRTRRTLERQLKEEKEKAQAANRAKSEFLSNMSHEIRTPLNGIIGFAELLEETSLSSIQEEYLGHISASGHALLGIINEILDFSKIEAGKLDLEMVETDLLELAEQSVGLVRYEAEQKELELLLDPDLAMPRYVFVDPVRLKQVLVNLLSNAVKFTERGEVVLQLEYLPRGNSWGHFTFSVRDTGIGIEEEQQKKLFQAFSQGDSSTTRKFGGTGLGLVISQKLVQKMEGELHLESTPGRGSRFSFTFDAECREGERFPHRDIPDITRILGVDDNLTNLRILEKTLAHGNIGFVGASNPLEAFRLLEDPSQHFDMVIMDYHMPYVDGLEAIRILRQDLGFSAERCPVILLHSSADNQEIAERSRDLGICFHLTKPVKSEELLTCLTHVAESSRKASGVLPEDEEPQDSSWLTREGAAPTIIVAEDNPANMLLMSTLIRKAFPSVQLVAVKNGKEAVRVAFEVPNPAILFMDVRMPEMDGNKATQVIRSRERGSGRRLPIIGVTAGATSVERERSLQVGMDDFLTKPIVPEKLEAVLVTYLGERNSPPVKA
jgi:PAS domain S-box-containing protein